MTDVDNAAIEEYVRTLLDACVALHNEVRDLPPDEREEAENFNFHMIDELVRIRDDLANEIRVRLYASARATRGAVFGAWIEGWLDSFDDTPRAPTAGDER